jgi:hypothetical protein
MHVDMKIHHSGDTNGSIILKYNLNKWEVMVRNKPKKCSVADFSDRGNEASSEWNFLTS